MVKWVTVFLSEGSVGNCMSPSCGILLTLQDNERCNLIKHYGINRSRTFAYLVVDMKWE